MASTMIQIAATKIRSASMAPERFSYFPWPKGWRMSAGLAEVRTDRKAMTAATRSMPEWMASERMAMDPVNNPTASFMMMRTVLEVTESSATCAFWSCES